MASIELFQNKEVKIAGKVFEAGMKKHAGEPHFIQAFIDFLHYANDESNLRVLFERILKALPPTQAKEVWNRFMSFENSFGGDSALLEATETRWAASKHLDPRRAQLPCLLHRYRFGPDLWPCSTQEVAMILNQATVDGAEAAAAAQAAAEAEEKAAAIVAEAEQKAVDMPRPDRSQLRDTNSKLSGTGTNMAVAVRTQAINPHCN